MKSKLVKHMSALLAVWYSLSIIGFDVHSCVTTGDSFVSLIVSGITCEDIHPEHTCHSHGSCCGGSHKHSCCSAHSEAEDCSAESFKADRSKCCTNDFRILEITGAGQGGESDMMKHIVASAYVVAELCTSVPAHKSTDIDAFKYIEPDSGRTEPDAQALLNIWRI